MDHGYFLFGNFFASCKCKATLCVTFAIATKKASKYSHNMYENTH